MAIVTINDTTLTSIAGAIRGKGGLKASMTPSQMASEIANLPTGGGFDMASLNYVEIAAASKYSSYPTLPDLRPYINAFSKVVAMYWCGSKSGDVYTYIRGLNGYRITLLSDTYNISSQAPLFKSVNNNGYYYFLDGELSGLKVKFYSGGTDTMSTAFTNTLVMLYEN